MLNRDGIRNTKYGAPVQILANVEHQYSVGCRVPKTMGVEVGGRSIVKAGTPINIDLLNINTPVSDVHAADSTKTPPITAAPMNAILLHNVDVTDVKTGGSANGTALIWGFVNLNRVETSVNTLVTAAKAVSGASPLLTFVKL